LGLALAAAGVAGVVAVAARPVLRYLAFYRRPVGGTAKFLRRRRAPRTAPVVVCAGDSLTHATVSADYVRLLRRRFPSSSGQFVNAGLNGDTTDGLRQRLDAVIRCDPDLVTLFIGTNDVRRGVPTDETANNLRTIITRLRAETRARVAVLSIPPLGEGNNRLTPAVAAHNGRLRALAAECGADFLPLHDELVRLTDRLEFSARDREPADTIDYLRLTARHYLLRRSWDAIGDRSGYATLTDSVHLNDRGAGVVAAVIANWIRAVTGESTDSSANLHAHR